MPPLLSKNFGRMPGLNRKCVVIGNHIDRRVMQHTDFAHAEAELRLERPHHTNTIKDKIVLQQKIAALKRKSRQTKSITR